MFDRHINRGVAALLSGFAFMALFACSPDDNVEGAGYRATHAVDEKQKVGATAKDAKEKAQDKGTAAFEGVNCTPTTELTGWCNNDNEVVWCAAGHFYVLDCKSLEGKSCVYTDRLKTVDCGKPSS